ncbi:bacteriocin-protection, YdeI or OmpD-associated-domain-containing protein [Hypoxylon sp. FL1150]|nr:bacteriocin-protection, YdeI or OmpD-associated-domain-containing protein [Hypoxylon sp. FL1150]
MPVALPPLTVSDAAAWSSWLFRSRRSPDEALCHGWIDGQVRKGEGKHASTSFSQRFTPRADRSSWSTRNDAAYSGSATAELPPEFLAAVAAVPAAQATYETLTRQNRYAIYYRLASLKTQVGRERRIAAFVEMLARGETPYPQKQGTLKPESTPSPKPAVTNTASITKAKDVSGPKTERPVSARRSTPPDSLVYPYLTGVFLRNTIIEKLRTINTKDAKNSEDSDTVEEGILKRP